MEQSKFKLINSKNESFEMGFVQSFTDSTPNRIIIRESATGNSSQVYFNGNNTRQIPIDFTLIGSDIDDLITKQNLIENLAYNGEIVEFISIYNNPLKTNKWFISNPTYVTNAGKKYEKRGSLTLIEAKKLTTQLVKINLINYASKETFLDTYNNRLGNQ